jgi:hypothetical protein
LYGGDLLKRPLERTSNLNGNKNPFTAMIAENPFAGQNAIPPMTAAAANGGFSAHSAVFARSSDDLLQEYGIDFSKLSAGGTLSLQQTRPTSASLLLVPTKTVSPAPLSKDPFADLDPLSSNKKQFPTQHQRPLSVSPLPMSAAAVPVAPPRSKRATSQQNNWTTFD